MVCAHVCYPLRDESVWEAESEQSLIAGSMWVARSLSLAVWCPGWRHGLVWLFIRFWANAWVTWHCTFSSTDVGAWYISFPPCGSWRVTYHIVGKFCGIQFSQLLRVIAKPQKLNSRNKLDCTAHNGRECPHPQKLNPQNSKDWLSTKIEPRKNFPVYSICVPSWKVT